MINKQIIQESSGVLERNMEAFAEYLWQRLHKSNIRFNKWGECNFTIPAAQWNKYNTYKIDADKMRISIVERRGDALAAFGASPQPYIEISADLAFCEDHTKFISSLAHELTHAINALSNKSQPRKTHPLHRHNAYPTSFPGEIEYLFQPTEMNARISEGYYYLKGQYMKDYYGRFNDIQDCFIVLDNNTDIANQLYHQIKYVLKIPTMEKQLGTLYKSFSLNHSQTYNQYKNELKTQKPSLEGDNSEPFSHLRFRNHKPSESHTFPQYTKHKLDIIWFLQTQLEKFKHRTYKMISKFITDVNDNKITNEYVNKAKQEYKEVESVTESKKKQTIIRLTEQDIHNIIKECILKEFMQAKFSVAELDSIPNQKEKVDYCQTYLGSQLGYGSSRVVFEIGDDEIIKLAIPNNLEAGISQNRMEYNNYKITLQKRPQLNTLFPKVYQIAKNETWIICERVLPIKDYDFETILGMPYSRRKPLPDEYKSYEKYRTKQYHQDMSISGFIDWAESPNFYDDDEYKEYKALSISNEWFKQLYQYIRLGGYLTDLNEDNFGIAIRNGNPTVVILDNGWDDMS